MITVHQSLNGDREGAYALLATSMEDVQAARRICNSTDMRARPGDGIEWSPAIRGSVCDNYYLVLKTFKDETPGVRSGRIFSHALIINRGDLKHIDDLDAIITLLPDHADKLAQPAALNIDAGKRGNRGPIDAFSREAKVFNALLNHDRYRNTLVWVGKKGFAELITRVWRSIPTGTREKLNFDLAFSPRDVDTNKLNIVCVPPSVISQWVKTGYCIINSADKELLSGAAAFYLAGDTDRGRPIADLLEQLQLCPADVLDFGYLQYIVDLLRPATGALSLKDLLIAADLISKYSEDSLKGIVVKQDVLTRLQGLIPEATVTEFVGIDNVDWSGFGAAADAINSVIENWLEKYLVEGGKDNTSTIVSRATAEKETANKCDELVKLVLQKKLKNWQAAYAGTVWGWWQQMPSLVGVLDKYLPADWVTEKDLANSCPSVLPKGLTHNLLRFCLERAWFVLHASVLMNVYPIDEAIERHLAVDPTSLNPASLEHMTRNLSDAEMIRLAIKTGNERIIGLTGARVAARPSLREGLVPDNETWHRIWLSSIEQGRDAWSGISNPKETLYSILDLLQVNKPVNGGYCKN